MLETIIVVLIVSMAAFTAGRSFCRTMTGKNDGCGCAGNCHGCACKDFAETVKEISGFDQNRKEQLPVTRDVLLAGNPSAQNHGPEAVRYVVGRSSGEHQTLSIKAPLRINRSA